MFDKMKLIFAMLLVAGGIFGFYWYEAEYEVLERVLALLVTITVAVVIAVKSAPGAQAVAYCKSAANEMRKTVWPTRKETTQTTIIVLVAVVIVGLIILLIDSILKWFVTLLIG